LVQACGVDAASGTAAVAGHCRWPPS